MDNQERETNDLREIVAWAEEADRREESEADALPQEDAETVSLSDIEKPDDFSENEGVVPLAEPEDDADIPGQISLFAQPGYPADEERQQRPEQIG